MTETGSMPQVDVSTIPDPDVRRALRAVVQINQQLSSQVHQQQQEIEVLLQMMIEKHVGSLGEFKRHMLKMQGSDARSERLHGQIAGTPTATAPPQPARHERQVQADDDHPRRYTL